MTLIVALAGQDGVVLAGDSRGTIGDPRGLTAINDQQHKVFRLSDYCALGLAGASELATTLIDELVRLLQVSGLKYADEVMQKARELAVQRYNDWFSQFKVPDRPQIHLILAGLTPRPDNVLAARVFTLSSPMDFAPQLHPNGTSMVGIPQYAIYLLHRLHDANMTVEHLVPLAAYLITETATQDPKVGGPVAISTVTSQDGYISLPDKEVADIIKRNERRNEQLRRFFYRKGGRK